ncbi:MAG: histidine--tRNA ligase [Salinibacterium sp.]|nr:MAG: histidine--tRNA ligase [Salinibacterium sp.]
MASPVNPPRGMRDFLPAEKAHRERVLSVIRGSFSAHGFDEIETPVMEDSSRLHAGLGGDNEKLAYAVMKRGLTREDLLTATDPLELADLGLRFDLTVPLARFYASHRGELPTVFRAIQIAPVWRAERPQKGRFRQFVQCDIDILGEPGMLAEIELITATAATLAALGLEGCRIRINDRRVLASLLAHFGVPAESYERALIAIDKEDKIGVDGVVNELTELGLGDAAGIGAALRTAADLPDDGWSLAASPAWLNVEAFERLREIRDAVGDTARLIFAPNLVRGMGYYTGPIFEIAHPSASYSLGGGGRYDGMIGRFLGSDVPAAGFSLGFERFVDLIDFPADATMDAVALVHEPGTPPAALVALQSALVSQGRRVRLERKPKNIAPLLEQLATAGFSSYALVTENSTLEGLEFRTLSRE